MILDILENAHRYLTLNGGFAAGFEFLARRDLKELPVDTYKIDGDRVYAMVSKDHGLEKENAWLEAHRKYIDIQLVLEGTDAMGWKPEATCTPTSKGYDPENDIQFYKDKPDAWLATAPGAFAIFFPEDAHAPLVSSGQLQKVVVKVAVA